MATLINTVNEVVERLRIVEQEQTKQPKCIVNVEEAKAKTDVKTDKELKESEAEDQKHPNGDTPEFLTVKNTTINYVKELRDCNAKKYRLKYPKCEYICEKKVNLDKHINTKHETNHSDVRLCNSKCSLCEGLFKNMDNFEAHYKEHMDDIEGLDITTLTNNHDMFQCNLCSFASGVGDSIKEHLIDHLNRSKEIDKESREEEMSEAKNLLDGYYDDGYFIRDHSSIIDSNSEIDSNDENL